jgi:hypothetical protein
MNTNTPADVKTKKGFGGFLIVALLAFIATPVKFGFVVYTLLTAPGALRLPLNAVILVLDLVSIFLMTVTFFLFIRKVKAAPALYIFHRLVWIIAVIAVFVAALHLPKTAASNMQLTGDMFGSIIGCLIFVPYFLFSKRVAATFVNDFSPGNGWDAMVRPFAPFLQGLTGFLRKLKLFIIPLIIVYAALTVFIAIFIQAAV